MQTVYGKKRQQQQSYFLCCIAREATTTKVLMLQEAIVLQGSKQCKDNKSTIMRCKDATIKFLCAVDCNDHGNKLVMQEAMTRIIYFILWYCTTWLIAMREHKIAPPNNQLFLIDCLRVFFLGDPSNITHVSYTQFATHITFYLNNFCILQGKTLSIYATVFILHRNSRIYGKNPHIKHP
jgi:hypothetical protein